MTPPKLCPMTLARVAELQALYAITLSEKLAAVPWWSIIRRIKLRTALQIANAEARVHTEAAYAWGYPKMGLDHFTPLLDTSDIPEEVKASLLEE